MGFFMLFIWRFRRCLSKGHFLKDLEIISQFEQKYIPEKEP